MDLKNLNAVQKILLFVLLPVLVVAFFLGGKDLIFGFIDGLSRKKTDDTDKDIQDKKVATSLASAKIEGSIETLEKEKADAIKKVDSDTSDPSDFYNKRK